MPRRDRLRDHRDADRLRRQRPHREDRAAHAQRGAQADRGGDAGRQRLLGRLHRARQAPGAVPRPRRADPEKRTPAAELPEGARPRPVDQRRSQARRVPGIAGRHADRPDAQQIHTMLLRSMQQAIYTGARTTAGTSAWPTRPTPTSPARSGAIPDLLVHRVIKALLSGKRYSLISGRAGLAAQAAASSRPAPREGVERWEVSRGALQRQRARADEASRDVEAWLKCRYMREHLGEEFWRHRQRGDELRPVRAASTACSSKDWSMSPNSAASTFPLRRSARNRAASAAVRFTVGRVRCRSAGSTWTGRKIDFRIGRRGAAATRCRWQRAARQVRGPRRRARRSRRTAATSGPIVLPPPPLPGAPARRRAHPAGRPMPRTGARASWRGRR